MNFHDQPFDIAADFTQLDLSGQMLFQVILQESNEGLKNWDFLL